VKKFSCRDSGVKGCNWEVTGQNDDEIVRKAMQHGRSAHQLNPSQDDEKKVRTLIKNA
jgi:predicted small metal-binding protein